MIALDTSVLVRCPTLDDPRQVPAAKALLAHSGGVFVAKTVLLELEWVLRATYKLTRLGSHSALGKLLGLPNPTMESPGQFSQAFEGYALGLDFADSLHLAAGPADGPCSRSTRALPASRPQRTTVCRWRAGCAVGVGSGAEPDRTAGRPGA